jgi:hypothetical protein
MENDPLYAAANIRRLNESLSQFREGKVIRKTFAELEEMAE